MSQPPNKIIPITTQSEPDGPHGICFRSIGVNVVIGTPAGTGLTGITPQPQPIPIATSAPCIGERCHAWLKSKQECAFVWAAKHSNDSGPKGE